jgi:hypothetical protein
MFVCMCVYMFVMAYAAAATGVDVVGNVYYARMCCCILRVYVAGGGAATATNMGICCCTLCVCVKCH